MKRILSSVLAVVMLVTMASACDGEHDDDSDAGALLILLALFAAADSLTAEEACPVVDESWCEQDQVVRCEAGDEAGAGVIRIQAACPPGACLEAERDGRMQAGCRED
ncbi:MAG TPA: hypothetical protein PK668_14280 [Myxococcota bacterium]|nr:hypothetical protein [Myxococcota bacterium]HRY93970.1 hypothetical protein [Myxococcota bacterium]HSA23706.1 hypothetical protein [Myxococcota bacterium]